MALAIALGVPAAAFPIVLRVVEEEHEAVRRVWFQVFGGKHVIRGSEAKRASTRLLCSHANQI
jgi:hypothetical protein